MRSNEEAFRWLVPVKGIAEQRDYPMGGDSLILAMTDLITHPPYMHDDSHNHNCMEIGLCVAGNGTITMEGRTPMPFEEGTVIIIPEGVHHSQQSEGLPATRWRYIAVDQKRLLKDAMPNCRAVLADLLSRSRKGIYLSDKSVRSDTAWLIGRMFDIKCKVGEESTGELEAILLLILMRISRSFETDDVLPQNDQPEMKPVEPALLYIAEQYHNEIKVAQLARSCAMSESHFRKIFAQHMGIAPMEYLNKYRAERAAHMIRTRGDLPVSRVAEACGFTSIATFNRNFIRYIGQKPTQIKREKAKSGRDDPSEIVQNSEKNRI